MSLSAQKTPDLRWIEGKVSSYRYLSAAFARWELFVRLAMRDVLLRYKQAAFGTAWAIFRPALNCLLLTFLFGKVAHFESMDLPYPVFVLAGLLPWQFFSFSVSEASLSLIANPNLITKVFFPRIILVAAPLLVNLIDLLMSLFFFIGLAMYYKVSLSWTLLLFPVPVAILSILSLAISMFLAAVCVKFRDIKHVIPFLIQALLFATPVAYTPAQIPQKWAFLLALNPLTPMISLFRSCLFGTSEPFLKPLAMATAFSVVLFYCSLKYFQSVERHFADQI